VQIRLLFYSKKDVRVPSSKIGETLEVCEAIEACEGPEKVGLLVSLSLL
jgi:hypothetical protein